MAMKDLVTAALIAAVKAHALKNYDKGWDIVIECYTDAELAAEIGRARTEAGAIAKLRVIVAGHNEQLGNCW